MNIANATVFITGGNAGIGRAFTAEFYKRGARVGICGRDRAKLEEMRAQWPNVELFECDVADEAQLRRLAGEIAERMPATNILINNAGVNIKYNFAAQPVDIADIEFQMRVNFFGPVKLTAMLLPHLRRQAEAAVVNISSGLALSPLPRSPIYCASKAAVHSFCRSLRFQLKDTNVRVFEVLAPAVLTAMSDKNATIRKMTPERHAQLVVRGIEKNRLEIRPGLTEILYWLHRISPRLADHIVARG